MAERVKLHWSSDGICTYNRSVVGVVVEGACKGTFYAYGCAYDWQDTYLYTFYSEKEARKAVEYWVKGELG